MNKFLSKISLSVFFVFLVLVSTSFILPGVPAQAAAGDPQCWAVFVGVSDYEYIPGLDYCDDDAISLYDEFSPVWGVSNIRLLTDSSATKSAILSAIYWLSHNAGPDDTVLFTFSGHGSDGLGGYFCPYDSLPDSYDNDITATELDDALSAINANQVVVVLDCCFAGIFQYSMSNNGRVIMMASSWDEESSEYEELEHGVFTYYILQAIDDFGFTDTNGDYELSAEEIFNYAGPETYYYAYEQYPVLDDGYPGELAMLERLIFTTNTIFPYGTSFLTVDGVDFTSIPAQFIWAPGTNHTLAVKQIVDVGNGTRYVFTQWGDGSSLISRTVSKGPYTAAFDKEYLLSIDSAYGSPTGAGWYKASSTADFSVTPSIELTDTKHIFTGWSGAYTGTSSTGSLVMDTPQTLTANWRNEYLLTVNSEYGSPTGAGWYNEGESAAITIEPEQGVIIRHIFNGWSGDLTGTNANANVNMTSPKVITATWRTDFIQLYILTGVVLIVITAVVVTVVLVRRRRIKA